MNTFMQRAATIAAATAGLALMGGTASSFAATTPSASGADQFCSQTTVGGEPNNGTTNAPCNVVPSYDQAYKDFGRAGGKIGGGLGEAAGGNLAGGGKDAGQGVTQGVGAAFSGVVESPVREGLCGVGAIVKSYKCPATVTDHQPIGSEVQ